jgi:hypothetical protein
LRLSWETLTLAVVTLEAMFEVKMALFMWWPRRWRQELMERGMLRERNLCTVGALHGFAVHVFRVSILIVVAQMKSRALFHLIIIIGLQ